MDADGYRPLTVTPIFEFLWPKGASDSTRSIMVNVYVYHNETTTTRTKFYVYMYICVFVCVDTEDDLLCLYAFLSRNGCRPLTVTPIFEFVTEERGRDGWRCAKSRSCSSGVTTMEDETSSRRDTQITGKTAQLALRNVLLYCSLDSH